MQEFWKLLKCTDYTALQQSWMHYLNSKNLIHQTGEIAVALNPEECLAQVKPMQQFLEENSIAKINFLTMTRHRRTFDQDLRGRLIMNSERNGGVRVEIPLIGADWSWHVFYRARVQGWRTQSNGMGYWEFHDQGAVEQARVKITRPMLIKTNCPHRIEFERTFLDRVNIIMQTDPPAGTL